MKLLVTRAASDAATVVPDLKALGHEVIVEPLLEICHRSEAGAPLAETMAGAVALLFTSANGVRAFAALNPRRDLPVLAVGDRTATAAREAGFMAIKSAGGDARALADLVTTTRHPTDGVLLHATGRDTAGDLAGTLGRAGFDVRTAELYEARAAAALSPATRRAIDIGGLDGILLFSPRTARIWSGLVREAQLCARMIRLDVLCLSAAVAAELGEISYHSVHVAAAPTQAALLDALGALAQRKPQ